MFIRRIKRKNGQVSVVLVEGYRENGKVKQRTVKYLGTESELVKDDPQAIDKLVERYRGRAPGPEASVSLTLNLAEAIPARSMLKSYGCFFLERMYRDLGLDALCDGIAPGLDACLRQACFALALGLRPGECSLGCGGGQLLESPDIAPGRMRAALAALADHKEAFVAQVLRAGRAGGPLEGCRLPAASKAELSASEILNECARLEEDGRLLPLAETGRGLGPALAPAREFREARLLAGFIALALLRMLEIRLGRRYALGRIADGLGSAQAAELPKGLYMICARGEVVAALEESFGAAPLLRYMKAEDLRRYRSKILTA
ncbi:MAG: hypothetical protein HUK26_03330 [Duodenibacillus sp.]|nr:hypothetical protein [Duodenibacillus sp.]